MDQPGSLAAKHSLSVGACMDDDSIPARAVLAPLVGQVNLQHVKVLFVIVTLTCTAPLYTSSFTTQTQIRMLSSISEGTMRHSCRFRKGRHEDAHEYLMNLLDVMHESMVKAQNGGRKPAPSATGAQPSSLIHHIFGGRMRNQVCSAVVPLLLSSSAVGRPKLIEFRMREAS